MKEQAEFCKGNGPVVPECPDCIDKYIAHAEAIDRERRGLILQVSEMKDAIRALVEDRERRANHPDPEVRLGLSVNTLMNLERFIEKRVEGSPKIAPGFCRCYCHAGGSGAASACGCCSYTT